MDSIWEQNAGVNIWN